LKWPEKKVPGASRTAGGNAQILGKKYPRFSKMVVDLGALIGVKRSGIYALSVPCLKQPRIIKVGNAKDLGARIDSYQLYHPFGIAVELLWIFPRAARNVDSRLREMERYIHAQLHAVRTTTRRRQTEWFWDSKAEVADAFLAAFEVFPQGTLVNPAYGFALPDLTPAEVRRHSKAKAETDRFARAQVELIRENFPRDYQYLCSCKGWEADSGQTFPCAR